MELTFEQLPGAVSQIVQKLDFIEQLLNDSANLSFKESETLLTISQAAEFISLSVPTVYGLVQRAEIPVSKKGKRLYFSKQELIDWIKAGRRKTNSEIGFELTRNQKKRSKI